MIYVPVSVGELIDKAVILEIKIERIKDDEKRQNCIKEYNLLQKIIQEHRCFFPDQWKKLKEVNEREWEILDLLRQKEREQCFDEEFIHAAREETYNNDQRAAIKRTINLLSNSDLTEEKQYIEY